MLATMGRNWWLIALRGAMAILLGILILLDPSVVISLIAAFAIVDGVFAVIQAFQNRGQRQWIWMLLEGIVGVIFGIIVLTFPVGAAIAVTLVIAGWAIATGIFEVVQAIRLREEIKGEFWLGLAGIASIIFGVLAILFPLTTFLTLTWLIAGYAIMFGVVLIMLAFRVRNAAGGGSTSASSPSRA